MILGGVEVGRGLLVTSVVVCKVKWKSGRHPDVTCNKLGGVEAG